MLHHARDVPARRHDGLMPGILVQARDDRSYRGTLVFQAGKHLTPDVVVVSHGLLLARGSCPSWDVRAAAISSPGGAVCRPAATAAPGPGPARPVSQPSKKAAIC